MPTPGHLSVGSLVVFAQAAIGASALAFGEFDWWLRTSAQPVPIVLGLADRMGPVGALASGPARRRRHAGPRDPVRGRRVQLPDQLPPGARRLRPHHPRRSSLAIVGQNGAGKTTLAKLLCRMYDPTAGAIGVDGVDLRDFDLGVVARPHRRRVPGLRALRAVAARERRARAARRTTTCRPRSTWPVPVSSPASTSTLSRAYAGGTDLSGGQWQRVALARALCAVRLGAGVVILDEPTAQLDVRGEVEIFERLLAATRGCTTILISHRFSTVRHADRICVVESGRVVELGTHDELVSSGGRYKHDVRAAGVAFR